MVSERFKRNPILHIVCMLVQQQSMVWVLLHYMVLSMAFGGSNARRLHRPRCPRENRSHGPSKDVAVEVHRWLTVDICLVSAFISFLHMDVGRVEIRKGYSPCCVPVGRTQAVSRLRNRKVLHALEMDTVNHHGQATLAHWQWHRPQRGFSRASGAIGASSVGKLMGCPAWNPRPYQGFPHLGVHAASPDASQAAAVGGGKAEESERRKTFPNQRICGKEVRKWTLDKVCVRVFTCVCGVCACTHETSAEPYLLWQNEQPPGCSSSS